MDLKKFYINGQFVDPISYKLFDIINPATENSIGKVAGFPDQPNWFSRIKDFPNLKIGLQKEGFSTVEIEKILGMNWLRFYDENFCPE